MRKRIVALILIVVSVIGVFSGCVLFEHNTDWDYGRVIVTIEPITKTWTTDTGAKQTYVHPRQEFTKRQLFDAFNNNGQSYIDQGQSVASTMKTLLDQMITRELILAEANALLRQSKLLVFNRGKTGSDRDNGVVETSYDNIMDSMTDLNEVWKAVYSIIDNQIFLYGNLILSDRGDPEHERTTPEDSQPTFPVMPDFDAPEVVEYEDTEAWYPDIASAPGDDEYLRRAAFGRLMRTVAERAEEGIEAKLNEEELKGSARRARKKELEQKIEDERKIIEEHVENDTANGEKELFMSLRDKTTGEPTLYIVNEVLFKDQVDTRLYNRMLQYITENSRVNDQDIQVEYDRLIGEQKILYNVDVAAFETALEGSDPVFYYAHGGYFYVKHILIPFSEEQTAAFNNFKSPELGNSEADIKRYRNQLGAGVFGKVRANGEETGQTRSYMAIYNEVKAALDSVGSVRDKEREFTRLMYKYNTDDGAFNSVKGYLVKPSGGQYMTEFEDEANELYKDGRGAEGTLSLKPILTDYGWHIIYLAEKVEKGKVFTLYDYQNAAQYKEQQFHYLLKNSLSEAKTNVAYENFAIHNINYFLNVDNGYVTYYESRYEDFMIE